MQFGSGLILARLLSPAEFGLVASVAVFTGFAFVIFEGGLRSALVHLDSLENVDYSTAFWLNALGGLILAGVFWLVGPVIADFFGQPELAGLAPVVALTFTFSLGVVHAARLQRALLFRRLALAESFGTLCGIAATLVLALRDAGPYALAWGPVIGQVVASTLLAIAGPWAPRFEISRPSIVRLLRYSLPLLSANGLDHISKNVDNLLVGRFMGPAPLGAYNRAYNLMLLPLSQISLAVGAAVSPALARMNNDTSRVTRAYVQVTLALSLVTVPVLVVLATTSVGLVPFLWGDQWSEAVPLLTILCLAGVPQCFTASASWLYQAQGRTTTMFKVSLLWMVVGVCAMVLGLRWGVQGVAWAVFARSWIGATHELWCATRRLDFNFADFIGRDVLSTVGLGALLGAAVWFVPSSLGLEREAGLALLLQLVVGGLVWVGLIFVSKRHVVQSALDLVRTQRSPA